MDLKLDTGDSVTLFWQGHHITFCLVNQSWLEIIGIVSDLGSNELLLSSYGEEFVLETARGSASIFSRFKGRRHWAYGLLGLRTQAWYLCVNPNNRRLNHQPRWQISNQPFRQMWRCQNMVPVFVPEAPDLSAVLLTQMPEVSRTEEPTKPQVPKRYRIRARSKQNSSLKKCN